jgi:uncharacterized protein (TIGR02231 family)
MQKRNRHLIIGTLSIWLLFAFIPTDTWSVPREVTLFPDSALVVESTRVRLQIGGKEPRKAMFFLPGQADPETLSIRPSSDSKEKIEDQTWRQIVRQDDAKISELKKQLETIKNERRNIQSSIQALNVQMQFWQLQTKAKMKTLADVYNMSAAIFKNTKKSYQEKINLELETEKLDKRIKELQEEIDRTVGRKETAWEVTVILSGTSSYEAVLTYSYSLSGCGWSPLYRLEAIPGKEKVSFSWEAEIWQSTGQNWNQVSMNLATLKPLPTVSPSELPPWVIKPRPVFRYQKESKAARLNALEDLATSAGGAPESEAAPQEVRKSTYSVWQLGRKNLPAGLRQRIKIQEEAWPADFSYMIRPSLGPQAFLRTSIRFPESREIPSGNAAFMIDGALIGKRQFSLSGKETNLYFGTDRLVTTKRTLLSKKSGEKGILTDNQTFVWEWRIDVMNSRRDSARVIVEEPNPQVRDERIKLRLKEDPEPSEKKPSLLIWKFDLPAGQSKTILSSVELEAPGNMNLDLGWQR